MNSTMPGVLGSDRRRSQKQLSRKVFVSAAVILAASVFLGFSRTYYLHRFFGMPDLSTFLHVHGVVMTAWIALFLIQTLLISAHQVVLHRNLGVLGIVSATLVVAFGISATFIAARREVLAQAKDVSLVLTVLLLEVTQMSMFAIFVTAGMRLRNQTDRHKRFMLLATLCMIPNALVRLTTRWPSFWLPLTLWSLLIILFASVDWAVNRKLHPVFARWATPQICVLWLAYFVGASAWWQRLIKNAIG